MRSKFKTFYKNGKLYAKIGKMEYMLNNSLKAEIKKLAIYHFGKKCKIAGEKNCFIISAEKLYENAARFFYDEVKMLKEKAYCEVHFK